MKIAVFISFLAINFLTFCQSVESGVDSVANRKWVVMPWKMPSGTDCFFKTEWALDIKPRILVLACEDSSVLTFSSNFSLKECFDSYQTDLRKLNNEKKAYDQYLMCSEDFYKKPENANKTDTLWMSRNSLAIEQLEKNTHSDWYITSETYYDSIGSFMLAVYYYTFEELNSACIMENPLKKRVESWENGQKNGNWIYYDFTGKIICEVTYSNGVLIKPND